MDEDVLLKFWVQPKSLKAIRGHLVQPPLFTQTRIEDKETEAWGFPSGTVVGNPPANAGDTGSCPGPGRSHMPRSNSAHAPQLLSLHFTAHKATTTEPNATTEAHVPRARAPQQEKPLQ